jgi:uncharacterized membrane protein
MTRSLGSLDRHFDLPDVARVEVTRPLVWLARGWDDLSAMPGPGLAYGVAFALAGWVILTLAAPRPYLVTVAVSGFFLWAPLLAAGLYELSRRRERGQPVGLAESFEFVRRNSSAVSFYGVFLFLLGIGWERISAIVFALFYGGDAPDLQHFVYSVFLSGDYQQLTVAWMISGFLLALTVFMVSVVSVPMMLDRPVDTVTAMMASARASATNLPAMAAWAAVIVGLTAIGFVTFLMGFVVIMPLLGHASWHAYRDLVR